MKTCLLLKNIVGTETYLLKEGYLGYFEDMQHLLNTFSMPGVQFETFSIYFISFIQNITK